MKYFESDTDYSSRSLASPLDLLRFVITCIFLSPIRLVLEVSKKIMFTGEYFKKFIMNCIYINVLLIILSILSSLFITKRFYLYGNLIPLPSLVCSLLMLAGFYYFEKTKSLEVDFELKDSIEDNINKIADVYGADLNELDLSKPVETKHTSTPSMVDNLSDEEEFEINSEDDFDNVYDSIVEEVMPTTDPSKRKDIASRLEEYKNKMKENAQLHESSTSIKQNFMDVKDQEQSKLDLIKSAALDSDDSSEFTESMNNSIGSLTSLLRNSPNLVPKAEEINYETSDDSPVEDVEKTLRDYNKEIDNRVKKRSASLDSIMTSSNSAKMVDLDESNDSIPSMESGSEFNNEYSTDSENPSSIAESFHSHLEASDSDDLSSGLMGDDFGMNYGQDFYGDIYGGFGMGMDLGFDDSGYSDPSFDNAY